MNSILQLSASKLSRGRLLGIAPVAAVALALGGCGMRPADRGFVQREWTQTFRELGIVPTFPPREDVMVGDVYAYGFDPNGDDVAAIMELSWNKLTDAQKRRRLAIGMNSRLTRLDLTSELDAEYQRSAAFPQTTSEYNSILGNPALAAAEQKVAEATAKVKKEQDVIDNAKAELTKAEDELLKATRAKEDEDMAVTAKTTKLDEAKKRPIDAAQQTQALAAATKNQRDAEDEVKRATKKVADLTANAAAPQAEKDKAAQELRDATLTKDLADLNVTRATKDLETRKAQTVDVSTEESALASAKADRDAAVAEVTKKTRVKEDRVAKLAAVTATQTPLIAAAQADLDKAKEIKKAIADAGVKMLYPQPAIGNANVFTAAPVAAGSELTSPRINRLRLVAFPDFSTVSITKGDLAALVPIEAMSLGLNVSSTNIEKIAVKVPSAESYAISHVDLLSKYLRSPAPMISTKDKLEEAVTWARRATPAEGDEKDHIYVRVVTEVFYARALDVNIFASSSFGARAIVQAGIPVAASAPSSAVNADATGNAMLADIERRITQAQTVPGGSVQVVSQNESAVGLRRVFDRPVAIGFRAVVLKIDRRFGYVEEMTFTDHGTPTLLLRKK